METFWSLTPRELMLHFEAYEARAVREHQRDAWLAWHIAALSRAKRLPSLRRLMGLDRARPLHGEELERRRAEHAELVANAVDPRGRRGRGIASGHRADPGSSDAR